MRLKLPIEELEAKLHELDVSTDYIDVANALSFELFYTYTDAARAFGLATETYNLCTGEFADYKKGLAEALINLAFYQADLPNLPEALRLILQAGTIADELNNANVSFKQLKIQRFIYALMEDYSSAIAVSFERMKLAQQTENPQEEIAALQALVYDCYSVDEHNRALAYSEQAFVLAERLNDDGARAHIRMYHTYPLRKLGQLDLALQYALEAYSFYQGQTNRDEAISLRIVGQIYLEREEYEKSMASFQQERLLLERLDNPYLAAHNECSIGIVYMARGQIDEAIQWLKSGIEWAESQDSKTLLLENYHYLVQAYKANKDFEQALSVLEKLAELRTEVNNTKTVNQRHVLLVVHETEQARLAARIQQERAEVLRAEAENLAHQNALIKKIDALKDQLVATASHDIRNPLAAMTLELDLLQRITQADPRAQKYVVRLQQNVTHVIHLVEDLHNFSHIQDSIPPELETCNLTKLIDDALLRHRTLARAKSIKLQVSTPVEPVHLLLDAHQIERVLDNLISNGIKYTARSGAITVTLSTTETHVSVAVRDTGRGIPADEIPHIFDSQFRASNSQGETGDGHGLSIVKSIVDNHHGEVVCESRLGEGTTFTVCLPFAPSPQPSP